MIAEVKEELEVELAVKFTASGAAASLVDDGIATQAEEEGIAQGRCRGASWTCKPLLGSKEAQVTLVDSPMEGGVGRTIEKGVEMAGQDTSSNERKGENKRGPLGPAAM